ncbi:MAG: hypothetical protein RSE17_04025 [Bacilli bacterium]
MKKTLIALLGIVLLIGCLLTGYYIGKKNDKTGEDPYKKILEYKEKNHEYVYYLETLDNYWKDNSNKYLSDKIFLNNGKAYAIVDNTLPLNTELNNKIVTVPIFNCEKDKNCKSKGYLLPIENIIEIIPVESIKLISAKVYLLMDNKGDWYLFNNRKTLDENSIIKLKTLKDIIFIDNLFDKTGNKINFITINGKVLNIDDIIMQSIK